MENKNRFNKRTYHRIQEVLRDFSSIMKQRRQIKNLMRGETLSDAFRERIMLTVTEVNGCRYCQYAHAKMALSAGLPASEIESLSAGAFHHCPPEEVPALLYAQHWAEENGSPDPEMREKMLIHYGDEKTREMELAMRMIRMGNLMGNTWDYVIYKLSFGKLGNNTAGNQNQIE